jgi:thiol-disulfide isomerase/thioredoxin
MRTLLTLLLLFACLGSLAQYQFSLSGTTPSAFNNKKVYLIIEDAYSSQKYRFTDSTLVQQNQFSFRGAIRKISEKATLYAEAGQIKGFIYFVVDSGVNTMVIRPLPPKWPLYKNKLSNTELVNSQSNAIKKALDSLTNHYYLTKGKPSAINKYVLELDTATRRQLRRKQIEILRQNPGVFYSIVHLYGELKTAGGFKIAEAAEVYDALDSHLQSSVLGTEVRDMIAAARSTEIGHPVPVFTIQTDKNDSFSNSSLRDAVYLLAFGATWCGPCKERLPMLNKIYEKYSKHGFQIVYVNLDEKTQLWKRQIEKYSMGKWINVSEGVRWEGSQMVKRFNVSAIPYYLLVNREGKIVYNPFQLNDLDYQQLNRAILSSLE